MTTRKALLFISFFALTTLKVMGQTDSSYYYTQVINRIDSLTKIIDKKNPKISSLTQFPDSLAGEKVISVQEQHYKALSKYTIQTNRTGNRMEMKYATIYLYHDTLLQASIFYNEDKSGSWEKFYYKNNIYFCALLSSHGMRFSLEGKDKQFVNFIRKIHPTQKTKKQR